MKEKPVLIYKDHEKMSEAAAHLMVTTCKNCIHKNGRVSVVLSGGNSPQRFHQLLTTDEFNKNISWEKVFVFFGDERYVPHTNPESNYHMAIENLLYKIKIPPKNIIAIPTGKTPKKDAFNYEKQVLNFFKKQKPRFDFLMLGIGNDGHTASLFPGSDALNEKNKLVIPSKHPETGQDRVSFSYRLINDAHQVVILASGKDKSEIIGEALNGKNNKNKIPVQGVQPKKGNLLWMIDEEAATKLV